jgi:hypothetical protein
MKPCMRRLRGVNSAAITRVEATTARVGFSPVSERKTACVAVTPQKYTSASNELSREHTTCVK